MRITIFSTSSRFTVHATHTPAAAHNLPHFKYQEGYRSKCEPSNPLAQRNRRRPKKHVQGWEVVHGHLQGQADEYDEHEGPVREHTYLPDCARSAAGAKGAQELGGHQHCEGGVSGAGEATSGIPRIRKGAQGNPGRETAHQSHACEERPIDPLCLWTPWRTLQDVWVYWVCG